MRPMIATALAVVVAVALAACGSDETETVTESRTETVGQTVTPPQTVTQSTAPAQSLEFFSTPTGNIGCAMTPDSVRCDIRKRDWQPPPKPVSCEVDWGQGLTIAGAEPAAPVCAGDTVLGSPGPTLAYGSASQVGPFRCQSESDGLTCQNTESGHGFFLSRQRFETY